MESPKTREMTPELEELLVQIGLALLNTKNWRLREQILGDRIPLPAKEKKHT